MLSLQCCTRRLVRLLCSLDKGQREQRCNMRLFLENLGQGSFCTHVSVCVCSACLTASKCACIYLLCVCTFTGSVMGFVSKCVCWREHCCVKGGCMCFRTGVCMHDNFLSVCVVILGFVNAYWLCVCSHVFVCPSVADEGREGCSTAGSIDWFHTD